LPSGHRGGAVSCQELGGEGEGTHPEGMGMELPPPTRTQVWGLFAGRGGPSRGKEGSNSAGLCLLAARNPVFIVRKQKLSPGRLPPTRLEPISHTYVHYSHCIGEHAHLPKPTRHASPPCTLRPRPLHENTAPTKPHPLACLHPPTQLPPAPPASS
jgi:hypothetical protein